MKIFKITVLCLFCSVLRAQNTDRAYQSHQEQNGKLEVRVSDGVYIIQPYTNSIVQTTFIPKGEEFKPESHAVVLSPEKLKTRFSENENHLIYKTKGITVSIQKQPFYIRYLYKEKPLISEKRGYIKDSLEILEFNLSKDETLYGGGARALGMNRRGNRLPLYNKAHYGYETRSDQMNFGLPLVMSSKMYAVHFDNAPIGFLDLDSKADNTLKYETISGRKTYQVIAGDSWSAIVGNYTKLTGRQPMIPRWALGNFSSRFGYHSEKETRKTVNKFIKDSIPLDAVILDLYWFGKSIQGTLGNFEFLKDSFPTPQKMINDFKKKGIKTILITEPFVLKTSTKWEEAVDKKILATDSLGMPYTFEFYFGDGGIIDIYKDHGKQWFWEIYKKYTDMGIGGWWGDLGEPEMHPSYVQHAAGSADEVHNIYGHDWARLLHQGYQKDFPGQRPFILMRAGYSGSQRFGMVPWSGDVNRSWGGLQSQPEIALQMGMQGLGYMHSDLGGFAGDYFDNELYTRWLQYGVFQPIFRPHAQESVPSEPVFKDAETKALAKKAIELRYRLLPYNYTLTFNNNQTGMPLMRSLFFEEPNKKELLSVADTYLWGNDFLVSPVMTKGATEKDVYFPGTANWIDFYTDEVHQGGGRKKISLVKGHIPTFVRAGAFVPMVKAVQNTSLYSTKKLQLHYYHDASVKESKGMMYDDDGKTPNAFRKGQYELLNFTGRSGKNHISITVGSEPGDAHVSDNRDIVLEVHRLSAKPKMVKVGGKKARFTWNEAQKRLVVPFNILKGSKSKIKIKR